MPEKTLGQLADEGAPICEAFDLVSQLAFARGWIPIGFRRIELPDGFVVTVNGSSAARKDTADDGSPGVEIPPYHASVWRHGWPLGIFTMFGGTLIVGTEELLIAALRAALAEARS